MHFKFFLCVRVGGKNFREFFHSFSPFSQCLLSKTWKLKKTHTMWEVVFLLECTQISLYVISLFPHWLPLPDYFPRVDGSPKNTYTNIHQSIPVNGKCCFSCTLLYFPHEFFLCLLHKIHLYVCTFFPSWHQERKKRINFSLSHSLLLVTDVWKILLHCV